MDSSCPSPSSTCSSLAEPSVQLVSTWVCPLWKSPEPCTLGRRPTSQYRGLISSSALPSGRMCSLVIIMRTTDFSRESTIYEISSGADSSAYSSMKCALMEAFASSILASRDSLSGFLTASISICSPKALTSAAFSDAGSKFLNSSLPVPAAATISSWNAIIFFICSWPKRIASSMSASLTSLAPASTIRMASLVPATTTDISEAFCSSIPGLMTNLPSTLPTLTPPIGPWKGVGETDSAIDAPFMATSDGSTPGSTDSTVATICTSFLNPSGKRGLMGLSIILPARIAASLGRPSRLMKPPGILPAAYILSS